MSKKGCTDPNALNYNISVQKTIIVVNTKILINTIFLKNLSDAYITPSISAYNDKINTLNNDILSFLPRIPALSRIKLFEIVGKKRF